MSKLMKISEFTDDQSIKVIANPEKDIVCKNSDKNAQFLIGQIDDVLMASIMIGYDGHRATLITLLSTLFFRAQAMARF